MRILRSIPPVQLRNGNFGKKTFPHTIRGSGSNFWQSSFCMKNPKSSTPEISYIVLVGLRGLTRFYIQKCEFSDQFRRFNSATAISAKKRSHILWGVLCEKASPTREVGNYSAGLRLVSPLRYWLIRDKEAIDCFLSLAGRLYGTRFAPCSPVRWR